MPLISGDVMYVFKNDGPAYYVFRHHKCIYVEKRYDPKLKTPMDVLEDFDSNWEKTTSATYVSDSTMEYTSTHGFYAQVTKYAVKIWSSHDLYSSVKLTPSIINAKLPAKKTNKH